ncbi:MAG: putative dehydrogenase [Pirellulaceae bacterium]|jgi:predicted dehydrogenase
MAQPNSQPVKVGVVGLGRFGRLHALTLANLAEAELVAVVARRQESIDQLPGQLSGIPSWTDLSLAVEESAADAWVVACTTKSHVAVTKLLLEHGKTVLLEKPIADNLHEAESLAPLVHPESSNLMIGHIVLYSSEYRELCNEVQRRGKISFVDCVRHRPASIVKDFPGENPLHATMVHDLYAVQVLLDRAEPCHFSAQYHRTNSGDIDLALAQLKWDNGTVASFAASFLTPTGMPARGIDRTEVFGDGWSARITPNPRPIEVWDSQASWPLGLEIGTDPPSGMMAEELRCFCRVAKGQESVPVGATYADSIQVQRWMEKLDSVAQ